MSKIRNIVLLKKFFGLVFIGIPYTSFLKIRDGESTRNAEIINSEKKDITMSIMLSPSALVKSWQSPRFSWRLPNNILYYKYAKMSDICPKNLYSSHIHLYIYL